jgi:drug/metabolite transporter (DMT)-like permease
MNLNQLLGAAGLAVGVILLFFAYQASNAPVDQISNALTGRYTDQTMWYLVFGVVAAVGGGLLMLSGRRSP